jgi:molybdenum cofactor cytidylyltransferase
LAPDPRQALLVTGEIDGDRTMPLPDDVLHKLSEMCRERSLTLLIEADGSRQRPLKAWAEHEPPIPDFVDSVVLVAGLEGLGRPLGEETVHRAHLFSERNQLHPREIVTREATLRNLLRHNTPWNRFPANARRTVLLNQADTLDAQAAARGMVRDLLSRFHSVVIANLSHESILAAHERVGGVILAAGESSRFGGLKQLLDWHGEPFARAVARKALDAGLSPVIFVTGAGAGDVEYTVADMDLKIIRNEDWKIGQSESIKKGIGSLTDDPNTPGGCIFLLADQPQITTSILQALVEKHAEGLHPIIAPLVMDRRANPVLFDRITFHDLLTLEGDVGGRAIFHKHPVEYLPWHDDRLLLDVDTPEQYRRLIEDETL